MIYNIRNKAILVACMSLLSTVVLNISVALACPDIDGLLDLNCDRQLKIVTFGDSITLGIGDSTGLGYPGRLNLIFPNALIRNYGNPGEKTTNGKHRAAQSFALEANADFIIILEGVNDFWLTNSDSNNTKSNLLSIVSLAENTGAIALLAKLTAVRRSNQKYWVSSVNGKIAPSSSIDFFSLGEGIIGGDLLHPHGDGYQSMSELAATIMRAQTIIERPVDSDGDGIYDFAEVMFGGNPSIADTDGDGLLDGEEVFTYGSSPTSLDSDNDGYGDFFEVSIGANPGDPKPTPPVVDTVTAVLTESS